MKEKPFSPENYLILTPENTNSVLQHIGNEREQKGKSELLIPKIDNLRQQAEKIGDFNTALILFQEKMLCSQHLIMEAKTEKKPTKATKGLFLAGKTAKEMINFQQIHQDKIDPIISVRTDRFLGRYYDQIKRFKKSEQLYKKGLDFFKSLEPVDQRYNQLEFSGFLAFSKLKQKKPEWFNLTIKTLSDFDKSSEGIWLRNNDYYTWAVWKSGVEIRTSDALLNTQHQKEYQENINLWIRDADSILIMPDGNRNIFQLRLDELNAVKAKLK